MAGENFYPLPTALPTAEVGYLLGFLRGEEYDAQTTIQAGWALAGFAQRQVIEASRKEEAEAAAAATEAEKEAHEGKAPKAKKAKSHAAVHALSGKNFEKALECLAEAPASGTPADLSEQDRARAAVDPSAAPKEAGAGLLDLGFDWKSFLKTLLSEVVEKLLKEV